MTATERDTQSDIDYFAANGLSQSAMKDLAISPLRFWYRHVRADRQPDEPSAEMRFGKALHCAILESEEVFEGLYCRELDTSVFPDLLVTIEDLRNFLKDKGLTPKGTRKADVIDQVKRVDPDAPILDVLQAQHAVRNAGKTILRAEDWARLSGCLEALNAEPRLRQILRQGKAEVPLFATDPDTGVMLKAKLDWVSPSVTLDVKTFSQQRGKSIDKCVADAIYYEAYYRQAYFYDLVRRLASNGKHEQFDFVMAFVESDPPHEVRLRVLRPKCGGEVNRYWETARIEVRGHVRMYAACVRRFGAEPWRDCREIEELTDEEMPAMAF